MTNQKPKKMGDDHLSDKKYKDFKIEWME